MLGSIRAVTDSTGQVVASFDYEPFGLLIEQAGPASAGGERYTGKPLDAALGLYYFGARYYDPGLGRFITADPAKHGLNWYVYCGANPMAYVDPSGMFGIYRTSYGRQPMTRNPGCPELVVTCFRVGMTFDDPFKIAAVHGVSLSCRELGLLLDVASLAMDAAAGDGSGVVKTALGMVDEKIASILVVPEIVSAILDQKLRRDFEGLYGPGSAGERYAALQLTDMLSALQPRYEGVYDFSTMIREADFASVIEKFLFNFIYRWPWQAEYRRHWYEYEVWERD